MAENRPAGGIKVGVDIIFRAVRKSRHGKPRRQLVRREGGENAENMPSGGNCQTRPLAT